MDAHFGNQKPTMIYEFFLNYSRHVFHGGHQVMGSLELLRLNRYFTCAAPELAAVKRTI